MYRKYHYGVQIDVNPRFVRCQPFSTPSISLHKPCSGGYKLELLDENENFLRSLTDPGSTEDDGDSGWVQDDQTAQSHIVTIPEDLECPRCTVSTDQRNVWTCEGCSNIHLPLTLICSCELLGETFHSLYVS